MLIVVRVFFTFFPNTALPDSDPRRLMACTAKNINPMKIISTIDKCHGTDFVSTLTVKFS